MVIQQITAVDTLYGEIFGPSGVVHAPTLGDLETVARQCGAEQREIAELLADGITTWIVPMGDGIVSCVTWTSLKVSPAPNPSPDR